MTPDFVLGQLRLALVAFLSYAGGKGWLTPADATLITSVAVALGPIMIPVVWSWAANWKQKMVPKDSVAIAAESVVTTVNPVGGTALIHGQVTSGVDPLQRATVAAKVVGALLFAFLLSALMVPHEAFAQAQKFNPDPLKIFTPKPATSTSGVNVSSFQSALEKFNGGIQSITKEVVDTAIADVQAAYDDATKKNDEISAPCWQAHLNLLKNLPVEWDTPPKMPIGIALGIQIQRDILNTINGTAKGTLKVDCAALYGDELKSLAGVGALLGIRIATGGVL